MHCAVHGKLELNEQTNNQRSNSTLEAVIEKTKSFAAEFSAAEVLPLFRGGKQSNFWLRLSSCTCSNYVSGLLHFTTTLC